MISLPVTPEDASLAALFPGAVTAFGWDYTTQNYLPAAQLQPEKAYWVLMLQAGNVEVCGQPVNSYTRNYTTQGWDLTGSVIEASPVIDDPDGSILNMFGWNPVSGQYELVSPPATEPKQGYWILVFQTPSTVTVGGAGTSGTLAKTGASAVTPAFLAKYGSAPPPPPYEMAGNQFAPIPESYGLSQNYPNPFNPETRIEYQMPEPGKVSLTIYNMLGQAVRRLVDEEKSAGYHNAVWNGKNDAGQLLPTGMYLYRLETKAFKQTRKILLLR